MDEKEIEHLEFMRGRITALKHVVAALVAMHPDSDDLVDIAKGMISESAENEPLAAYTRGLEKGCEGDSENSRSRERS